MKKRIVGKYHHEQLGYSYILELKPDNTFIQMFIKDDDTFLNMGRYSVSLNIVSPGSWKSKEELLNTPSSKGGCFGCELKYENGNLNYYNDPDGLPTDVFIKYDAPAVRDVPKGIPNHR